MIFDALLKKLNSFFIRKASPTDIDNILEIQNESALSFWSKESYVSEIINDESIFLSAFMENDLIGFVLLGLITSTGEAEVLNFAVKNEFRGKGFGKKILDAALSEAHSKEMLRIYLEVRESNRTARRFYLKYGFKESGIRKNFYRAPVENAILMSLEINQPLLFGESL